MRFVLLSLGLAGSLAAQAIVERAVTTGTAATASGGAKATGAAIGKTLGNVGGVLAGAAGASSAAKTSGQIAGAPQAVIAPAVPEKADAPAAKVPAPDDVKTGMTREELLKSFGEPASKMSMAEGSKLVERFRYSDKISYVRVVLEDGKVKEVTSGKNQ